MTQRIAEKYYSLKELEKILGRSRPTLLKYVNNGELKAVKTGNAWRVSERDLAEYLGETDRDEE